jgi:hypothetical protein
MPNLANDNLNRSKSSLTSLKIFLSISIKNLIIQVTSIITISLLFLILQFSFRIDLHITSQNQSYLCLILIILTNVAVQKIII